ncbi:uncharacterized protein [Dysidea avara]|uniref:uncharacterized protein isoform X2 n=1 Tax=Dysidea avara TaxID=196820 RepID=UPI003321506A
MEFVSGSHSEYVAKAPADCTVCLSLQSIHVGVAIMTSHLLVLLMLLASNRSVLCQPCDNIVERNVDSSSEFTNTLLEVQRSPIDNNSCYLVLFDSGTLELSLSSTQTFNISSNMILEGRGTTVKCIFSSFNYRGIISVNNVQYFGIRSISFVSCPTTFVLFENISSVEINASSFSQFTEVPIYLFNSPSLLVVNCMFVNNTSSARHIFRSYEGNAGSLSYGWNDALMDCPLTSNVLIYNCTFYNNSAQGRVRGFNPSTDALETRTFTGRGGGIALVYNTRNNVTVVIEETVFERNHANGFGGGLFILIDGISVNQYFNINNNLFLSNTARFGAAAIFFGYLSSISPIDISEIIINNCSFIDNHDGFVGSVSFALTYTEGLTNFLRILDSKFYNNIGDQYGAAVGLFHANFLSPKTNVAPLEVNNCEFIGNGGGRGGTLSIAYFPIIFKGNVTFVNNTGPAFRAVGSRVTVRGAHLTFLGNNAEGLSGGAMYLTSYTQVILFQGSTFDFINNTGSIGASVVVETQPVPSLFSRSYYNRLCFLQFDRQVEDTILPEEWENVTFRFRGNSAFVGSAFFIDRLSYCSWNSAAPPFFSLNETFRWSFMDYSSSNRNFGHDNDTDDTLLDLQTPPITFSLNNMSNISSYPGRDKVLQLKAYDELNHPTAAIFRFGANDTNKRMNNIQFNPSAQLYQPVDTGITLRYTLTSFRPEKSYTVLVTSDAVSRVSEQSFLLYTQVCRPGYTLQNSSAGFTCKCDDGILIETCIEDDIILRYGLWAHYTGSELFLYQCPPGYCQCHRGGSGFSQHDCLSIYTANNESLQCDCNREGLLCGRCKEGKGVTTLLNRCTSCIGVGWLLIVILVVVDASVAALVIVFAIKIPSWLLPFLFYTQITPYIMENLTFTFSQGHRYLYFLGSLLSFYFPYDFCLFHEMDAVLAYGLRYIPISTTGIVTVLLFSINKICLIRKWKFSWDGVWTLIILQYSHVVYTSMSILNCPVIPVTQGDDAGKWYIDATTKCFHGTHAIIGVIAIVVLALAGSLVIFVGLACSEAIFKEQLRNFTIAVRNANNSQCKWWPSVELFRRILILVVLLPFPGKEIPPLLIMMLIFSIYLYFLSENNQLSRTTLYFETILIGNIIVMLALKSTRYIQRSLEETIDPISIDSCQNSQVLTKLTLLLLVLYYMPILIVPLYPLVLRVGRSLAKWMDMRKIQMKNYYRTEDDIPLFEPTRNDRVGSVYIQVESDGTVTMSQIQ